MLTSLKNRLLFFLAILVVLSAVYAPAISGYYAHHDDYVYFALNQGEIGRHPFWKGALSNGRYLASLFYSLFGVLVSSVARLNLVRFFCIVEIAACGYLCFSLIQKYLKHSLQAFLLTIGILTLPPFEVFVAWGINAGNAPAILFACLAFYCAQKAGAASSQERKWQWTYGAAAVFLMCVALSTYQPGAMFYWFLTAVVVVLRERPAASSANGSRGLFSLFAVGFISTGIYFVVVQLLRGFFGTLTNRLYNPYAVTSAYGAKLSWFIREPLINAVNLWNIFPNRQTAFFILAFIAISAVTFLLPMPREKRKHVPLRQMLANGLIILSLIFLSFLPNLAAVGDAPFYRCSVALTPVIFLICFWAIRVWTRLLPDPMGKKVLTLVLGCVALYGAYQARENILRYRVIPSQRELVFIEDKLRRADLYQFRQVHFIRPDAASFKDIRRYDEFGVPTTFYRQDIPLILKCALREIGLEPFFWYFYPRITSGGPSVPPPNGRDVLIIDTSGIGGGP